MKDGLRIGVLDLPSRGWTAGPRYIRTLVQSLRAVSDSTESSRRSVVARAELFVLSAHGGSAVAVDGAARLPITSPPYVRGEWRVRHWLGLPDKSALAHTLRRHGISVVLPLITPEPRPRGVGGVGWIPDFQHRLLPRMFSLEECRRRDEAMARIADETAAVIVSSDDARAHFAAAIPGHAAKARVLPFPSRFAFEPVAGDPTVTLGRFNLPEKFALVANQFWRHKNHAVVVGAAARLRRGGLPIPIVMSGLPADHRDPDNETVSRLLQEISAGDLRDQVVVLGLVPDTDLVNLLRMAAVVIQPSRFEGWSTVVQDAIALGRPVICSDIAVHREQAPGALGWFSCDDAEELAAILATHWSRLEPGPSPASEAEAVRREREFARRHGEKLLDICREAAG